jgi:hypothetical protein
MSYSIVPVNLAVKSMRDSGYKNTAFALAELIDNSVQHGANNVELICLEKMVFSGARNTSKIDSLCVLDNGCGMNTTKLRQALQFGNGTNLDPINQTGIGKFGMGLPSSSISQAKRVDVWSWQNGIENAIHSYLDIDEIISGQIVEVPEPVRRNLPESWLKILKETGQSGTIVIWSKLDRCLWKTGKTIIEHSENIVGRMYRKFINSGTVNIKAKVFREGHTGNPDLSYSFMSNDPMYLMENTSVSKSLGELGLSDPMFVKYGGEDGYEKKYSINFNDAIHEVFVRYSMATEETRKGINAGSAKHGKHAKDNVGISVLRASRELDLDRSWVNTYDPRERWWGVEIEFPPALDEVFGVTNNKQAAVNFREMGSLDLVNELRERNQTMQEYKEELLDDNDPKVFLIEIANDIKNQLSGMRRIIKAQSAQLEIDDNHIRHQTNDNEAEIHATQITIERRKDGYNSPSDLTILNTDDKLNIVNIERDLINAQIPNANEFAEKLFTSDIIYQFLTSTFDTRAFFSVSPIAGKIIIYLNTNHPAYEQFVEVLSDNITEDLSKDDLILRLKKARNGMKLLLMAWARYEDEEPEGRRKDNVRDARTEWGKMAAAFMRNED